MVRVLEVISDTNIGGAGVLLATRCSHMDSKRFDLWVAMPKGSMLKQRFCFGGVSVIEFDGCYDRSLEWKAILRWVMLLKRLRPAVVNCHSCFACRIAARLCGVPVLIDTRHCAYPPKKWMTKFPGKWLIGALLNGCSDYTIAVAEAARQNLTDMGVKREKIQVIINGAEGVLAYDAEQKKALRAKHGIPEDAVVIGIFARLEPCKDHKTFLRAASLLSAEQDRFFYLIVGDGSQKKVLRQYAHRLGISNRIRFVGFVSDVTPYFNITDIQVNCSVGTETSSLALSEGMSIGIPCVVSNYGGNPYMVRNGKNGFVVPVGREDLLAERIKQIASDAALYRALSEGALERFEKELNAKRMADQVSRLYLTALQR